MNIRMMARMKFTISSLKRRRISRAQLLEELLPGLKALFGFEQHKYGQRPWEDAR